jgi:hypothetical protein
MTTEKVKSKNPVPNRERIKMPRLHMPEQAPSIRAHEFTEVNLGYSAELARQEAIRCLECGKPTCTNDCPVGVKVKDFVQLIVDGDFMAAAAKIREDNVLPAITGRVRRKTTAKALVCSSEKASRSASDTWSALSPTTSSSTSTSARS